MEALRHTSGRVAALVAAMTLSLAAPGSAQADIPPGFDLFETDPQSTLIQFSPGSSEVPAGFFGPGSDPFTGTVSLGGIPLETFNGLGSGGADTVVRRNGTAVFVPPFPDNSPPVPIEIVALNLVSMQPITVTYGGQQPELWDLALSVNPPAQPAGQVTLQQQNAEGGIFGTQFPVLPKLTFTRLSDGLVKSFDVPNLLQAQFTFSAGNVPWRTGCESPALRIVGLNDLFCPALTPQRTNHLMVAQANLARHGVYPVQPRLEHFKCYGLQKRKFVNRLVTVADQFGQRQVKVLTRAELCNPVQKNREPLLNRRAHLQCYGIKSPPINRVVAVRNQFGSQRLLVRQARRLCLPTTKREQGAKFKRIQVSVDHFQCYSVAAQSDLFRNGKLGKLTLKDQFHRERKVKVGKPVRLCAPASKNGMPIQHPVGHFVCYRIRGPEFELRVQIKNQFENVFVDTRRPRAVCVPSDKLLL